MMNNPNETADFMKVTRLVRKFGICQGVKTKEQQRYLGVLAA